MVKSSDGFGGDFGPHRESLDQPGILMDQLRRLRSVMGRKEGNKTYLGDDAET